MAVIETWYNQDLQQPVKVHYLDGSMFSHNGNGNRIGVHVFNNGDPVALSGTVSGYVVTADGSTVPCTGTRSGQDASILIPAAAYQPGAIFITVFLTDGSTVTTLASVATNVLTARTNNQVSPGSVVTDWTQTINAAMQAVVDANAANMATPYASLTFPVPLGKYCIQNNLLYRCTTPIATSEAWTAAHWTQVRLGDDVSDLKSALNDISEDSITIVPKNMTKTGHYYDYTKELKNGTEFWQGFIDVTPGEVYYLTSKAYYTMARYATLNPSDVCLRAVTGTNETLYEDTEITIEANETQLVIQALGDNRNVIILKKYNGKQIKENQIEEVVDSKLYHWESVELDFTAYPNKVAYFPRGSAPVMAASTGYNLAKIAVTPGETYWISGRHYYSSSAWGIVDSNDGGVQMEMSGTGYDYRVKETITVASGGAYMYVQSADLMYLRKRVPGYSGSPNSNKTKYIIFDGDSICENRQRVIADNGGAYARFATDILECDYFNYAISGARLITKANGEHNSHSVVDTVKTMPNTADLYCLEGGINDYWNNEPLGTFSESSYTDTLDESTVCGALESAFRHIINNFVGKNVCFIIPHKITDSWRVANTQGDTFSDYRDKFIGLCNKYSIPYWDGMTKSGLNAGITVQNENFLNSNSSGTADGTHPNANGYKKFYARPVSEFLRSILQ